MSHRPLTLWARTLERRLVLLPLTTGRAMPENPSRNLSPNRILRRLTASHHAVCLAAAAAFLVGIAIAATAGRTDLAVALLVGVSLTGLVCFVMDVRA